MALCFSQFHSASSNSTPLFSSWLHFPPLGSTCPPPLFLKLYSLISSSTVSKVAEVMASDFFCLSCFPFAPLQKTAFLKYHQNYCCVSGGGQHRLMQLLPSSLFRLNHINLLQDHYKAIHGCLYTQKSHLPANWMDEWRGNYNFLLWNHRPLPLEQQENFYRLRAIRRHTLELHIISIMTSNHVEYTDLKFC